MATYPFLIYGEGLPAYWHDFDCTTSAEMVTYLEQMITSGDVMTGVDAETGKTYYSRIPATAISKIKVYYP